MRFVAVGQNVANTKARSATGYKGVYQNEDGSFTGIVRRDGETHVSGTSDSLVIAAWMRDNTARKVWGKNTRFNIPGRNEQPAT
jgi:hypothetical protein